MPWSAEAAWPVPAGPAASFPILLSQLPDPAASACWDDAPAILPPTARTGCPTRCFTAALPAKGTTRGVKPVRLLTQTLPVIMHEVTGFGGDDIPIPYATALTSASPLPADRVNYGPDRAAARLGTADRAQPTGHSPTGRG